MVTFKYTTDALRKLRFSANFCGHKTQEGSRWLQATFSVLVARCVCCLPDREFTLSLPGHIVADTTLFGPNLGTVTRVMNSH